MKKILVVGNGFDLAHGLPTKYNDFLYFLVLCIDAFSDWKKLDGDDGNQKYYECEQVAIHNILQNDSENDSVKKIFDENRKNIEKILKSKSMKNHFSENDLLKYMICVYANKQNFNCEFQWIDVEDELMRFVKYFNVSNIIHVGNKIYLEPKINGKTFYCMDISQHLETLSDIPKDKLKSKVFEYIFKNLEQFSSLLKMYLKLVMDKFHAKNELHFKFSSNVQNDFYFSHIISFNYTNTSTIYNSKAKIYYVNGCLKDKNIILGIENPFSSDSNEYLDDNVHLFFKNVQRILYDFKYKHNTWFKKSNNDFYPKYGDLKIKDKSRDVYIVGHSLALSDKYILLDIFEQSDNITIFYYNDDDKKSKITNLYKILGDEKFYKYVNNNSAKHKIVLKSQSSIELKS